LGIIPVDDIITGATYTAVCLLTSVGKMLVFVKFFVQCILQDCTFLGIIIIIIIIITSGSSSSSSSTFSNNNHHRLYSLGWVLASSVAVVVVVVVVVLVVVVVNVSGGFLFLLYAEVVSLLALYLFIYLFIRCSSDLTSISVNPSCHQVTFTLLKWGFAVMLRRKKMK